MAMQTDLPIGLLGELNPRAEILDQVLAGRLTGKEAADRLGISLRQTRRLLAQYREEGVDGLLHGNRGRTPSNKLDSKITDEIVRLARDHYPKLNNTQLTRVLAEKHQIVVSVPTIRQLRIDAGLPRRRILKAGQNMVGSVPPVKSLATQQSAKNTNPLFRILDLAGAQNNIIAVALTYLVFLTIAEVATVYIDPRIGVLVHIAMLLLLMAHTVRRWAYPDHRLWFSLTMMPMVRIISVSLPLVNFTLFYWFLFTSIPLFASAIFSMQILKLSWHDVGVTSKDLPFQVIVIGSIGILLGITEYYILRPSPLVEELTWQQIWLPALIILISTGLLEELIFRGIVQQTAIEQLGRSAGILYGALFFAILHLGYKSLTDMVFVFIVGVLFGWIVLRTKNIIGVTIAHGLTNITLFLIMPFYAEAFPFLP